MLFYLGRDMKNNILFAAVALVVAWLGADILPRGAAGLVVFLVVVLALYWLVKYLNALSARRKE